MKNSYLTSQKKKTKTFIFITFFIKISAREMAVTNYRHKFDSMNVIIFERACNEGQIKSKIDFPVN